MSLTPEDLAAVSEAIIGRELVPATFTRSLMPPARRLSRLRKLHEAAGPAACGRGKDYCHRDSLRLRVLGIGPLLGCLPLAVW
jgi:hypothetical protein